MLTVILITIKDLDFALIVAKNQEDTLTVKVLFYNTLSNYFSYDARFLKSVVPLLFKPGYVAKEFVLGRRLKYLHPAQYYLFASVLFSFSFPLQCAILTTRLTTK